MSCSYVRVSKIRGMMWHGLDSFGCNIVRFEAREFLITQHEPGSMVYSVWRSPRNPHTTMTPGSSLSVVACGPCG